MAAQPLPPVERRRHDPEQEDHLRSGTIKPAPQGVFRSLGLGLITGAADDDPSAIGTLATAGATLGPSFLWIAPVTFPMMFAVVYLGSKLGQVTGQGLFAVIRRYYSRWLLYSMLVGVLIGNIIEAGADIGGMAAALNQCHRACSHRADGRVHYGGGADASDLGLVQAYQEYLPLAGTGVAGLCWFGDCCPARTRARHQGNLRYSLHLNKEFLAMLLAVIGTSLSAYLYSWQSNQDVEEDISMGRRRLVDRIGTSEAELHHSARDVAWGMLFASLVMYFIMLSSAATLFRSGQNHINTAAEAAQALRPVAGNLAGVLFAVGVIGVGFLAVPIMTTGAAYDVCQTFGWKHGLHYRPAEAKKFNLAIAIFTVSAMCLNFFGINPMKALVWAGIVQGLSTPFLMLLVMLITTSRRIMGRWVNTTGMNVLGWITTAAMFLVTVGLVVMWLR
jgi:Mn2+/Fe2+ NRAMP family transporter